MLPTIEITAQDTAGVRAALAGGAGRVELCAALGVAGITPSIATIELAVQAARDAGASGFVDVLIRPREGDFRYDREELLTAVTDISRAVAAGVDGVVFGALTSHNTIDVPALKLMMEAAGDTPIVFHRAFDVLVDQRQGLDTLMELGFSRLLTSGGAYNTGDGIESLGKLVCQADGRIEIMAGGGVRLTDIPSLVDIGIDAIHMSARETVTGGLSRPGEAVPFYKTDVGQVRAAVAAVEAAKRT